MQSRVFLVRFATLVSHAILRAAEGEPAVHLTAKETKQVLGCTCTSVASRPRKVILLPLHPAFVRSLLEYVVFNFGLPSTRQTGTFCSNSS